MDTNGLLLMVVVHPADLQDRDGGRLLLERLGPTWRERFPRLETLYVDSAYNGYFEDAAAEQGLVVETVARPADAAGFVPLPKRWVVERTFAWLGLQRRLVKDYEQLPEMSEAMVQGAMVRLMVQRLALAA